MWKNEECLIVAFLQGVQESASKSEDVALPDETIEMRGQTFSRETAPVPKWLKTATPEGLAKEILEFKDDEFPKDETIHFGMLSQLFWSKKGVERFLLPLDVRLKIEQANIKAERQFEKEENDKKKAKLADEKEELPSIMCQCVDWAIINGLKRVTLSEIDTFLMEKDIDILYETRRMLYSTANLKLKTGK
jgi:hypothetical protein